MSITRVSRVVVNPLPVSVNNIAFFPSVAAGNYIVVAAEAIGGLDTGFQDITVTDSQGNLYTGINQHFNVAGLPGTGNSCLGQFHTKVSSSGSLTVTVSIITSAIQGCCLGFIALQYNSPSTSIALYQSASGAQPAGLTVPSGTITLDAANSNQFAVAQAVDCTHTVAGWTSTNPDLPVGTHAGGSGGPYNVDFVYAEWLTIPDNSSASFSTTFGNTANDQKSALIVSYYGASPPPPPPPPAKIYRDVDLSGTAAAINGIYETSYAPGSTDESMTLHDYHGMHMRASGSGAIAMIAFGLDRVRSVVPLASPFALSASPGIEVLIKWALRSEQQSIRFSTNAVDSYFILALVRAYYQGSLPQR